MAVDDCRLLVDLDGRNAAWVAAAQLTSAFRMPARWRRPQAPPGPPVGDLRDAGGTLGGPRREGPAVAQGSATGGAPVLAVARNQQPAALSCIKSCYDSSQCLLRKKAHGC